MLIQDSDIPPVVITNEFGSFPEHFIEVVLILNEAGITYADSNLEQMSEK